MTAPKNPGLDPTQQEEKLHTSLYSARIPNTSDASIYSGSTSRHTSNYFASVESLGRAGIAPDLASVLGPPVSPPLPPSRSSPPHAYSPGPASTFSGSCPDNPEPHSPWREILLPGGRDAGEEAEVTEHAKWAPATEGNSSHHDSIIKGPVLNGGLGGHMVQPYKDEKTDMDRGSVKSKKSCVSIRLLGLDHAFFTPDGTRIPRIRDLAFVIADLPKGHTVGFDNMAPMLFNNRLRGVHSITPGLHFVWVSPHAQNFPKSGFWFFSRGDASECRVLQWNRYNKTVGPHAISLEERIIREELTENLPFMSPYTSRVSGSKALVISDVMEFQASIQEDEHSGQNVPRRLVAERIWYWITNQINPRLLSRVTGRETDEWRVRTSDPVRDIGEDHVGLDTNRRISIAFGGSDLAFSFARMVRNLDASDQDSQTDTTPTIVSFLRRHPNLGDDDLVGELQFLFVSGAVIWNPDCLQLWWQMVHAVVLRTYTLPLERPLLAQKLLFTLAHQFLFNDCNDSSVFNEIPGARPRLRHAIIVYKLRLTELFLSTNYRSDRYQAIASAFSAIENWAGARYCDELRGEYVLVDGAVPAQGENNPCVDTSDVQNPKCRLSSAIGAQSAKSMAEKMPVPVQLPDNFLDCGTTENEQWEAPTFSADQGEGKRGYSQRRTTTTSVGWRERVRLGSLRREAAPKAKKKVQKRRATLSSGSDGFIENKAVDQTGSRSGDESVNKTIELWKERAIKLRDGEKGQGEGLAQDRVRGVEEGQKTVTEAVGMRDETGTADDHSSPKELHPTANPTNNNKEQSSKVARRSSVVDMNGKTPVSVLRASGQTNVPSTIDPGAVKTRSISSHTAGTEIWVGAPQEGHRSLRNRLSRSLADGFQRKEDLKERAASLVTRHNSYDDGDRRDDTRETGDHRRASERGNENENRTADDWRRPEENGVWLWGIARRRSRRRPMAKRMSRQEKKDMDLEA